MGIVNFEQQVVPSTIRTDHHEVKGEQETKSQNGDQTQIMHPSYQMVNGLRVCGGFIRQNVLEAMNYKASPDDLFIATYPKCGTTWTQQIVSLLLNDGNPASGIGEYFSRNPFIDMLGQECIKSMIRPSAIKTHFPFQYVPYHPHAKYICVVRNPKDALVSFYHHTKGIPGYQFSSGSFDAYFELFLAGQVDYGDYFDHLISWWEHRNDSNVIFLTFEQMKADIKSTIRKLAEFIDPELVFKLESEPEFMVKIVKYSSFEYMKEQDKLVRKPYEMPEIMINNPTIPRVVKEALLNQVSATKQESSLIQSETSSKQTTNSKSLLQPQAGSNTSYAHIRKGIVNDWKNHMSEEQNERLVRKFVEKTSGTGIESLWVTKDWL